MYTPFTQKVVELCHINKRLELLRAEHNKLAERKNKLEKEIQLPETTEKKLSGTHTGLFCELERRHRRVIC